MRILLFRTNGNVLDINRYNSQELGLAKALRRQGIECDIAYYSAHSTKTQNYKVNNGNIKIYWIKGINIAGNGFFFKIDNILNQYDIIQVSEYDQIISIKLAFFSKYRNKVVIYHGPYLTEYNKKYQLKCKVIDRIPLSKNRKGKIQCFAKSILAKEFLQMRGFKNVLVTGVGLDTERLVNPSYITGEVRNILKEMDKGFTLLYIGNIEPRRNIKFMINLMKKVCDCKIDANLIIVGSGNEEYQNECLELIEKYSLQNRIKIFGKVPQEQISVIYEKADIFLLPTSYEIYGMVMMEAMYYGLPVITTRNGGSLTVIKNKVNGCIEELNEQKWFDSINELYTDFNKRYSIGENARKTILNMFTWDSIVRKIIPIYEKMVL